jgi:hypothetical protein
LPSSSNGGDPGSQWFGSRGKQLFGSAVLGSAAVVAPGLGGNGGWGSSGGSSGGGGGGWGWNPWGSSSSSGAGGNNGPLFDLAAADDGSKPKKKKGKKKKKKDEEQQPADEDDGMDISESEDTPNVEEENKAALLITSDTQLDDMIADAGAEGDGQQRHGTHRCVEVRDTAVWWHVDVLHIRICVVDFKAPLPLSPQLVAPPCINVALSLLSVQCSACQGAGFLPTLHSSMHACPGPN